MTRHQDRDAIGIDDGYDELEPRREAPTVSLVPPGDRDTDPTMLAPTEHRRPSVPAQEVVDLSETVALRLVGIDDKLAAQGDILARVEAALASLSDHLVAIRATTDTLPEKYVELANEYLSTKQEHVVLLDKIERLQARVKALEPAPATNGHGEVE
jgi:hypothetical protein